MSLNIYLETYLSRKRAGSGIYIRENGQNKQISRQEWDERYPGREPVVFEEGPSTCVWQRNITHNLNTMAEKAGLYKVMWRPEEIGVSKAKQAIVLLEEGLGKLEERPDYYKRFNPDNGWGDYEGLVDFVEDYLMACRNHPEATIRVSR